MLDQKDIELARVDDQPIDPGRRRLIGTILGAGGLMAVGGGIGFILNRGGQEESPTVENTTPTSTPRSTEASVSTVASSSPNIVEPKPNPNIVDASVELDLPLDLLPTSQNPEIWVSQIQELKRIAYNETRPELIPFIYSGGRAGDVSSIEAERIAWTKEQRELGVINDLNWTINWRLYPERTTFPYTSNIVSVDVEEYIWTSYEHRIMDLTVNPKHVAVKQNGKTTELTLYTIVRQEFYCTYPEYGSNDCVINTH